MQGGKNWILPKEMNASRFFWDPHWPEIGSDHLFPSMGPKGEIVAMDSQRVSYFLNKDDASIKSLVLYLLQTADLSIFSKIFKDTGFKF
jgi:hypothetical protein